MNQDPRKQLAETMAYICWVIFFIGLVLGFFAGAVLAGDAPEADLTAAIPICSEIKLALADFEGLHSDAYAQYEQMINDLCALPYGAKSHAMLEAWFNGADIPPDPVPLPISGTLLLGTLGALALISWIKR